MLASKVTNHPVVSTRAAATVARLEAVVVDPASRVVVALRLKRTGGHGKILNWADVVAFGPDAVTVESAEVFAEPGGRVRELLDGDADLARKRLLTDAGAEMGTVTDIEFDAATGAVVSVIGTNGILPGDHLLGCGRYAAVVRSA